MVLWGSEESEATALVVRPTSRERNLIDQLGLRAHPEGGWYAEVFRSDVAVQPLDGRGVRVGLTTIYFLLTRGQRSRLHRVTSDEVWHFYEGDPLQLTVCGSAFDDLRTVTLAPFGEQSTPVHVVRAHEWQAAQSLGDYTLVGCTVGPGFEFADFAMLSDDGETAERFLLKYPHLVELV